MDYEAVPEDVIRRRLAKLDELQRFLVSSRQQLNQVLAQLGWSRNHVSNLNSVIMLSNTSGSML